MAVHVKSTYKDAKTLDVRYCFELGPIYEKCNTEGKEGGRALDNTIRKKQRNVLSANIR